VGEQIDDERRAADEEGREEVYAIDENEEAGA
jgi:hypothetical protein